ncbi:MAG: hypothetical protein Q9173_005764 [Seirophora scorigena]
MSLKRKRSSESASPPTANASSPSVSSRDTSPVTLPHTFRLDTRMTRPIIPSSPRETPHANSWGLNTSNLHSRTQKRLRNNRPPESEQQPMISSSPLLGLLNPFHAHPNYHNHTHTLLLLLLHVNRHSINSGRYPRRLSQHLATLVGKGVLGM